MQLICIFIAVIVLCLHRQSNGFAHLNPRPTSGNRLYVVKQNFDKDISIRRIGKAAAALFTFSVLQFNAIFSYAPLAEANNYELGVQTRQSPRPQVYSIESSVPPTMQARSARGEKAALERIAKAQFVLIGDHVDYPDQGRAAEDDSVLERSLVETLVREAKRQRRSSLLVFNPSPQRQAWVSSLGVDIASVTLEDTTEIERKVLSKYSL